MMYFPDNTTTKFITKLPRQLSLHGDWAVSLAEIEYPMNFLHVPESGNFVTFENGDYDLKLKNNDAMKNGLYYNYEHEESTDVGRSIHRDAIPSGVYQSIDSLIETINRLSKANGHLTFKSTVSGQIEVVRICDDANYHDFRVSPAIAKLLGFNEEACNSVMIDPECRYVGVRQASLSNVIPNTMFVYTDICENYITGDVQTPLLRTIPIESENYVYGASRIKTFPATRYIPLIRNSFGTIEIDIRDEYGKAIPFVEGTLTVTLQFKRLD